MKKMDDSSQIKTSPICKRQICIGIVLVLLFFLISLCYIEYKHTILTTPVIGSYVGNGESSRTIDLGFTPKYGLIYVSDEVEPLAVFDLDYNYTSQSLGIVSESGDSYGVRRVDNGFSVDYHEGDAANAAMPYFNREGITYAYIMWR